MVRIKAGSLIRKRPQINPVLSANAASEPPRLAAAAADARDELRSLDHAISENHLPIALLERVRDGAIRHAESLRLELKHPAERARGPLWAPI